MTTEIYIKLLNNPANFEVLDIVVNGPEGFVFPISKTFVTGVPSNSNQVQILANKFQTVQSLIENLIANNGSSNIDYALDILNVDTLIMNFGLPGVYMVTVNELGDNIEVGGVEVELPEPEQPAPTFEYAWQNGDFQIQIIDTYENDRSLIVELTKSDAPVLSFEGSESINNPIWSGQLSFNMQVAPSTDAHFIHLFTGDENRYLVKLNVLDDEENMFLVWQGYLLPDQYAEPYIQVQQFVEFVATDMIKALKGKFLPPWYYYQTLPTMYLISEILSMTGLNQPLAVRPGVIPSAAFRGFEGQGVPMENFREDKGFKDVLEILEAVLEGQGLTLYSIKGIWYMESFARKSELGNEWLYFDEKGVASGNYLYEKVLRDFDFVAGSINITAIPDVVAVTYEPEINNRKSLYPEDIVVQQNRFVRAGSGPSAWQYNSSQLKHWSVVALTNLFPQVSTFGQLFWFQTIGQGNTYNVNSGQALLNYIQSNIRPYIESGQSYKLSITARVRFSHGTISESNFNNAYKDGKYDNLVCYRLLVNGVELVSNRPGFAAEATMIFEKNLQLGSEFGGGRRGALANTSIIDLKLEHEFVCNESGEVNLRFLAPIGEFGQGLSSFFIFIDTLALVPVVEPEITEKIIARRPVASTVTMELQPKMTATSNRMVINSFYTGFPISSTYFNSILITGHNIISGVNLNNYELSVQRIPIELISSDRLFKDLELKNATFMEKADGSLQYMPQVLTATQSNQRYLGWVTDITPADRLPEPLQKYAPIETGDLVKYMFVWQSDPQWAAQDVWKTHDEDFTGKLGKCLARQLHGVEAGSDYSMTGDLLGLMLPDELLTFYFDNEFRVFVPMTLTLNLFDGKTAIVCREMNYQPLNDITYE
jgi:hypothetical protein